MSAAVFCGQERLDLVQLQDNAARVASGLVGLGLCEGDKIAIMMRNDTPYLEAMMGASRIGIFAASVNWHLKGSEVAMILADSQARALVIHADLLHTVRDHLPEDMKILCVPTPVRVCDEYGIDPSLCTVPEGLAEWHSWRDSHDAWQQPPIGAWKSLIYTSGTTGNPKGVCRYMPDLDMANQLLQTLSNAFGLEAGKKTVMCGPLYHSATNGYSSCSLRLGNDLVLMERFDAEELLKVIEQHKISHLHMVPTMFVRLLKLPEAVKAKYDVSSLEHVIHGAAPCPLDVKRQMIDWWGPVINEYYGATETSLMTTIDSENWLKRPGSVGQALEGTELKILDEDGAEVKVGVIGDIYVRNRASILFTYYNKPEQKTAMSRGDFVTNGDMGYLDDDGFLYLCDRRKDMIISGGVNIFPVEIEDVLSRHPSVNDCAVFGLPHGEYGEEIVAAIQADKAIDVEELKNLVRENLANYKVPRAFHFLDNLPREDSGKIFKRKIRDQVLGNT